MKKGIISMKEKKVKLRVTRRRRKKRQDGEGKDVPDPQVTPIAFFRRGKKNSGDKRDPATKRSIEKIPQETTGVTVRKSSLSSGEGSSTNRKCPSWGKA